MKRSETEDEKPPWELEESSPVVSLPVKHPYKIIENPPVENYEIITPKNIKSPEISVSPEINPDLKIVPKLAINLSKEMTLEKPESDSDESQNSRFEDDILLQQMPQLTANYNSQGDPHQRRPSAIFKSQNPDISINPPNLFQLNKQKASTGGYLQIGDIICLITTEIAHTADESFYYTGVISGDGIASSELECVPKKPMQEQKIDTQFRQCLFRIEPARQYGFSSLLSYYERKKGHEKVVLETQQRGQRRTRSEYKLESQLKKFISRRQTEQPVDDDKDKIMNELRQQALEEMAGNEAEFELSVGRVVAYGERIQLRHIHSDGFITTSLEIAKEHGCLKLKLAKNGNEGSWFEVMPGNKLRQEGEMVRYLDEFELISSAEKSKYYLHMGISMVYSKTSLCELNASEAVSL